jgi:signal transduction histidine kinase
MKRNHPIATPLTVGHELVKAKAIINDFVYGCSHTMRGPLKSIAGLVNLLRLSIATGKDDPQAYVNLILQSVDNMEMLLHQLEQFLENSRKDLTLDPVDLEKLVVDTLHDVQADTERYTIRTSWHIDQSGYFFSDVNRLRLILQHLVSNAVSFRDEDKADKVLEIEVKATSASCSIQVSDNGIGIPYEIQGKIFDLFYRGSGRSGGSGVGLHIVQEVLKKMGGSISVNSVPKQGSNFFIWLPNMS